MGSVECQFPCKKTLFQMKFCFGENGSFTCKMIIKDWTFQMCSEKCGAQTRGNQLKSVIDILKKNSVTLIWHKARENKMWFKKLQISGELVRTVYFTHQDSQVNDKEKVLHRTRYCCGSGMTPMAIFLHLHREKALGQLITELFWVTLNAMKFPNNPNSLHEFFCSIVLPIRPSSVQFCVP